MQYPQAPTPETWSSLASVLVEHHGLVSSTDVQFEWVTPLKLNGKTQEEPAAGPPTVIQLALWTFLIGFISFQFPKEPFML